MLHKRFTHLPQICHHGYSSPLEQPHGWRATFYFHFTIFTIVLSDNLGTDYSCGTLGSLQQSCRSVIFCNHLGGTSYSQIV